MLLLQRLGAQVGLAANEQISLEITKLLLERGLHGCRQPTIQAQVWVGLRRTDAPEVSWRNDQTPTGYQDL
jgi:hypothetical protein